METQPVEDSAVESEAPATEVTEVQPNDPAEQPRESVVPVATPGILRRVQTGYLYHYAFAMFFGVTLILAWLLWA